MAKPEEGSSRGKLDKEPSKEQRKDKAGDKAEATRRHAEWVAEQQRVFDAARDAQQQWFAADEEEARRRGNQQ